MPKKCIYCKTAISEEAVLDVCRRCGIGVWGEQMYNAILENMGAAKESGNLFQGSVTQSPKSDSASKSSSQKSQTSFGSKSSLVSDAVSTLESAKDEEVKYDSYNKRAA